MQITGSLKSWKFVLYCCLIALQMQKSEILWQVLSVEDSFLENFILQLFGYLALKLVNSDQEYFIYIFYLFFSSILPAGTSLKRDFLCPSSDVCDISKRNCLSVSGTLL